MWGGNDVGRAQIFSGPCWNAERFEIREGGKAVPGSRDASGVESATSLEAWIRVGDRQKLRVHSGGEQPR
jgi:hypothetical protein